jgi:subtilisin family serine protease
MKKLFAVCVVLTSLFVSFETPISAKKSDKILRAVSPIANHYIVVLDDQVSDFASRDVESVAMELTENYSGKVNKVFSSAVRGYSIEMSETAARQLSADSRVAYIEEDSYVEAQQVVNQPGWGLDRIDQRALPFDTEYHYNSTGAGVNVYVIDTGVLTTHQALLGRAFDAYNATTDHTPVENCSGHGTGVAGVVASSNYGVAHSASIYSVRVLPCSGEGTLTDVIDGVDWVTRHASLPAVANMSLRAIYSRTLNSSTSALVRAGVTVVVAAGNDSSNACNYSPGSTPEAITVGGLNSTDTRLDYSNYGSCVSIFAPGEGVATIWNNTTTATTYMSGTSFASPYVAGVAALYLGEHPTASPADVRTAIVGNATADSVVNPGANSPNLLLYSLFSVSAPSGCAGTEYVGSLASVGASAFQSGLNGFSTGTGSFDGELSVPDGATFSLVLEKKAKSRWSTVVSNSGASNVQVSYRGRSGQYRWRIASISGVGNYSLCSQTP